MIPIRTKLVAMISATIFLVLPASSASAQSLLVSKMGAKCLDVEGSVGQGRRLIGWACHGGTNQQFSIAGEAGRIVIAGYCLDAKGGQGKDGDEIILWPCAKNPDGSAAYVKHQLWTIERDRIKGINGKCLVLRGGSSWWGQAQPAILFTCNGTENEYWYQGVLVPANKVTGGTSVAAGTFGTLTPSILSHNGNALIGNDGASLQARLAAIVAGGGGNIVAGGGGNIVAAGGGNVIVIVRSQ